MQSLVELAVVGGSGFYEMPGLSDVEELTIDTPYGATSDNIRVGTIEGRRVAFLARHGRGHRLLPSELPQQANFWALKSIGVKAVLAVSAVGSLREELRPGDLVVPDQLIDRLRGNRPETFFGGGVVAHIGMGSPFCDGLRKSCLDAITGTGDPGWDGGSYIVIEGPSFGTRAESLLYRQWGASIVGMTALPEARFAREAEVCYATIASVTDYDSWHESEGDVTAETVFAVLQANVARSQSVVRELARTLDLSTPCACNSALDAAMVTPPRSIPAERRVQLEPILARWFAARSSN